MCYNPCVYDGSFDCGKDAEPMDYKSMRLFLFDMDGTIYLGYDLFPFTSELLATIREQGHSYLFMTNNSSKSVADYVVKMKKLGIDAVPEDFITSSQVTAMYLLDHYDGKKLYVSGTESFKRELESAGVKNIYDTYRDDIDVVVMGFDTELTFRKLEDVSKLLVRDLPFIAANPDLVCPTEFGYVPDCGSVCGMIYNATGKKPYYIGKPRPEMPLYAMERMKTIDPLITKENTLVIGDRIYTDIACGVNAGVNSLLVLSGETTAEQAAKSETKPTAILPDCGDLLKILKSEE